MRSLFDLLAAQRRFIYLVVGLLSAAGVYAATKLPSAIYPELAFPRILVVTEGSSLGARQMVFTVTRPIEEEATLLRDDVVVAGDGGGGSDRGGAVEGVLRDGVVATADHVD